ncbi:MAG: WD40 repeat domain-containing protein [Chloroflexi bacterium]|nr:WD40 repeat domain-containing protein [Chloroflexota bacterium]
MNEAKQYEDLNELESAFIQASQNAVEAERTAHEAARQTERDLENTRKLAQFEKDRRRVVTILGAVALMTSFIAMFFWSQANTSASVARDAAGTSQANAITAQVASTQAVNAATQSAKAEAFANISLTSAVSERNVAATAQSFALAALSRQLATQARSYLSSDLTLALLLGVESLTTYNTSEANTVLRDAVERKLTRTTEPLAGRPIPEQDGLVLDVKFGPDGRNLAWSSGDSSVSIWNIALQQQRKLWGHTNIVESISFSPDGQILASGDRDGTIILWDIATGDDLKRLRTVDNSSIVSVAISPDGKTLAAGRKDGKITTWNIKDKKFQFFIDAHKDVVRSIAWSPDSTYFVSGSSDKMIRVWKANNGEAFLTPPQRHQGAVSSVAWSLNGKWFASGSLDRSVILWDVATGEILGQTPIEHQSNVLSISISYDSKILASGSEDSTIILWDVSDPRSPKKTLQLTTPTSFVTGLAFSPLDNILVASSNKAVTVRKILIPPQSDLPLKDRACALATRNFSKAEWEQLFTGQSYRKTCVQFAEGK